MTRSARAFSLLLAASLLMPAATVAQDAELTDGTGFKVGFSQANNGDVWRINQTNNVQTYCKEYMPNVEVVVTDGKRYLAASCPAGPAFEGGLIRFGMAGGEGAIESIRIDGDRHFEYSTIGATEPEGICGSGLVDILAELRSHDMMNTEGRFSDGLDEFVIAPDKGISFSRADTSLLAQAKAANACGQRILLRQLGVTADQVDKVYLAGGFANAVNVKNAIAIGLIAPVPVDRVERVGNAAVRGAAALLLSSSRRDALDELIGKIEHVELETELDFFELFVDGCRFIPLAA